LIVFDASTIISAALKADSIPERAMLRAEEIDVFALSAAVDAEIAEVLGRPKFGELYSCQTRLGQPSG
jgi:predicted nucleic acid-binding protein